MEIWQIIALCVYFLSNGILLRMSLEDNDYSLKSWKIWLLIMLLSLFGSIVIGLFVAGDRIKTFWQDVIWTEIRFYWNVCSTTFFDDIVAKDPNALWNWNRLWRRHKEGSWTRTRLKRHVALLNKKFDYDYEADKAERERKEKEWDKEWEKDVESKQNDD